MVERANAQKVFAVFTGPIDVHAEHVSRERNRTLDVGNT
jgi:hypothetical protein